MSKEKINPGENCPFCGTQTAKGSCVCIGCNAVRKRDVIGLKKYMLKAIGFVAFGFFIATFITQDNKITYGMLSAGLLCGGVWLGFKHSEYIWQRPMPK